MTLLSIIYVARDDKYGDEYNVVEFADNDNRKTDINFYNKFVIKYNNIQRIKFTLEHNIRLLDTYFKDDYEIIFIDWAPFSKNYLTENAELYDILRNVKIKNIIVEDKIVKHRGLNPKGFYEYFGKNIGIRQSKGKYILVSNPDDVLSETLMINMLNTLNQKEKNEYYRCYSRFDSDHNLNVIAEGLSFPPNGNILDEVMGTPASGDFLLTQRQLFINMTGYHEEFSNGNQSLLDGKLVIKLYNNKIIPTLIKGSIFHLDHKKHDRSGGKGNWTENYKNDENTWGFNMYKLENIDTNIYNLII
jgi:hypothetical protein